MFQVRGIACKILRARKHDVVGTEKKKKISMARMFAGIARLPVEAGPCRA